MEGMTGRGGHKTMEGMDKDKAGVRNLEDMGRDHWGASSKWLPRQETIIHRDKIKLNLLLGTSSSSSRYR